MVVARNLKSFPKEGIRDGSFKSAFLVGWILPKVVEILGEFIQESMDYRGPVNCDTSVLQLCDINMETNGALPQIFRHCVAKTTS